MFTKLYDKLKEFFLKNYRYLFFIAFWILIFSVKLPYTIDAPGGYINVSERIEVDGAYDSSGSFNMAYVSELDATIPTLIYALINPNCDIVKNEDILLENETIDDLLFRNKLAMQEAKNNAIIVALNALGYTYDIKEQNFYVAYIDELSDTTLEVGDIIVEVDSKKN